MDPQTHEELTQYEKYRIQKLTNLHDDDNFSAHFSNISCNISTLAKSDRNIRINSFRSTDQNQEDFLKIGSETRTLQLHSITQKYQELEHKYNELLKSYKEKQQEAEKYKKLYEEEMNRERQTKQKLKNWVKQAKTNLNH